MQHTHGITGMSGDALEQKPKRFLPFVPHNPGQSCPHPCSQHCPHGEDGEPEPLGEPMNVSEVARLIGCSVWIVRQKFLHKGLPHFRSGDTGKLIFYRDQVIRWVLSQQKKGGS